MNFLNLFRPVKLLTWKTVAGAIVAVVGIILVAFLLGREKAPEIDIQTSLEKLVPIQELSTTKTTYRGVAEVMNEKNSEKLDYYVAYEADVTAGIDVSKVTINKDDAAQTIFVDIPEITLTSIELKHSELDYFFYNKKSDTIGIEKEAIIACQEDIHNELNPDHPLYTTAKNNIVNALSALMTPIVEQMESEYTLTID